MICYKLISTRSTSRVGFELMVSFNRKLARKRSLSYSGGREVQQNSFTITIKKVIETKY